MDIINGILNSDFSKADEFGKEGIAKYLQKDYHSAIQHLTKALEISPKNIKFLRYRGNAYEDLKEYRYALSDYFKANQIKEHHTNYHSISFCYMQLNERQPAVDACNNALKLKINNKDEYGQTEIKEGIPVCIGIEVLYNNRAVARLKIQDFEGALSDVEKALQINPNYSQAKATKALIETMEGISILSRMTEGSSNYSSGDDINEFKKRIISHANSPANVLPNGLRLRDGMFYEYAKQIISRGRIPYAQIIILAKEYAQKLFKTYLSAPGPGSLDDFNKGVLLYELSCAFSKIYPSLKIEEVFEELINEFIKYSNRQS